MVKIIHSTFNDLSFVYMYLDLIDNHINFSLYTNFGRKRGLILRSTRLWTYQANMRRS